MIKDSEVNIGVVDAGGRGHVLVERYLQSPNVGKVFAFPGNDFYKAGNEGRVETFPQFNLGKLDYSVIEEMMDICVANDVYLLDVAQDNAVAEGVSDQALVRGCLVNGPTMTAGQIEWSKIFARTRAEQAKMPQPYFEIFPAPHLVDKYIKLSAKSGRYTPKFIKIDGLAAGKGAGPARTPEEALATLANLEQYGQSFIMEDFIVGDNGEPGEEFSAYVAFAGNDYVYLGDAQDHKRAYDHTDQEPEGVGENTGGMGCSSRPSIMTDEFRASVCEQIFDKVPDLLGPYRPYKGVLYLGGMRIKKAGLIKPMIVEFNARWGDPEIQVVLPGIENDWFDVSRKIAEGNITGLDIQNDGLYRVVVVGAAKGYPGNYDQAKGKQIHGLDQVRKMGGVRLYGAGIRVEDDKYYANGGRLFGIVGEGKDVNEAREKAYNAMDRVSIDGDNLHFRTDIGWRDIERLWQ